MARTSTTADERAAQRQLAKDRAASIVGRPVTHDEAAAILRGDRAPEPDAGTPSRAGAGSASRARKAPPRVSPHLIPPATLDPDDPAVTPLGLILVELTTLTVRSGVASATLACDVLGFGDVLRAAAGTPAGRLVALELYAFTRGPLGADGSEPGDATPNPQPDLRAIFRAGSADRLLSPASRTIEPDDLAAEDLTRVGLVLARPDTFKVSKALRTASCSLSISTNADAYEGTLYNAVQRSLAGSLVGAVFTVPASPEDPDDTSGVTS